MWPKCGLNNYLGHGGVDLCVSVCVFTVLTIHKYNLNLYMLDIFTFNSYVIISISQIWCSIFLLH